MYIMHFQENISGSLFKDIIVPVKVAVQLFMHKHRSPVLRAQPAKVIQKLTYGMASAFPQLLVTKKLIESKGLANPLVFTAYNEHGCRIKSIIKLTP